MPNPLVQEVGRPSERRDAILDAGCADHLGLARLDQDGSFSVNEVVRCDAGGAKLFIETAVGAHRCVSL
jgi:hypothetical protein